jgi:hypothetical protein
MAITNWEDYIYIVLKVRGAKIKIYFLGTACDM